MKRLKYVFCALALLTLAGAAFSQTASEQVYVQRLTSLKSPVDLVYNPEVKKHIDAYLANPEKTREMISLCKVYFPMIEKSLRSKNVPTDLKYLAFALSELDPQLQTTTGASGIWMMPYNISKMYKLKVNSYIDERRDPQKSSVVAATHFKDLFSIYRQWPLAIAAYVSSPVILNKSIRMAGNSMAFWDLYPYIPEGAREAYPKFVAAAYICNFYKEHGIKAAVPALFAETDSVVVQKWLSFQQIESTLDIPVDQLRRLNPVFKKDVIPFNVEGYLVRLPKSKGKTFGLLKDSVYKQLADPTEFTPVAIQRTASDTTPKAAAKAGSAAPAAQQATAPKFDKQRVSYTVKRGDIMANIADWFDVTPAEIKSWNKLKSDRLMAGQKLTIWVKQSKTGYYKRINTMSAAQKKKLKSKD